MAIHIIVLTCPPDEPPGVSLVKRVKQEYPTSLPLSDSSILVRSQEVADQISDRIGLKGDARIEGATGVVLKQNGVFSGYASTSVWDWLTAE